MDNKMQALRNLFSAETGKDPNEFLGQFSQWATIMMLINIDNKIDKYLNGGGSKGSDIFTGDL